MTRSRATALLGLIAWFAYWGHAAFVELGSKARSEQSALLAGARENWEEADTFRSKARSSAEAASIAITLGFAFPLFLLAIAEAKRVQYRRELQAPGSPRPD